MITCKECTHGEFSSITNDVECNLSAFESMRLCPNVVDDDLLGTNEQEYNEEVGYN